MLFVTRALFIPLLLLFALRPALADWHKQEQAIMGTAVSVELWLEDKQQANSCIANVMKNMRRIDALMSPYKPDSELSRINRSAATAPMPISDELFRLIQQANRISNLTKGHFDITYASVGFLYDFRKGKKPDQAQLSKLVPAINYRLIQLGKEQKTIHFAHPNIKIDLGGIAKGHAVDQGIAILRQCGVKQAIVSAGGDSRLLGDRRGRPWMTGIRHPRQKGKFALILPMSDTAISTSGDYERFFIQNGVRYHHIINPASGKPAGGVRSVTIIGPDTTTTDALSTASFVLGPESALKMIEKLPGIDAIIIDGQGQTHYTSGLHSPK